LEYTTSQAFGGPAVRWCGIELPHVWRCGNRGNVASVLIEKPARGDFLPILDGGYALQYSPLLEYREGEGLVLFCQMDVTGRTEQDPAAETLAQNLLGYLAEWKPSPRRQAIYVGHVAGRRYLELAGISAQSYEGGTLSPEKVLIVAAGGGEKLIENRAAVTDFIKSDGHLLALGLDQQQAKAILPFKVGMTKAEHIACYFEPPRANSLLAGIAPADLHNRDPRLLPLVSAGAAVLGDGVLAQTEKAHVVFYQFPPYDVTGAQGTTPLNEQLNLRRTYRRSSFALARLLANMGISAPTPLLSRFSIPVGEGHAKLAATASGRWSQGLYLDQPSEWDDPYRFFRW
jgi:hypothetical protein